MGRHAQRCLNGLPRVKSRLYGQRAFVGDLRVLPRQNPAVETDLHLIIDAEEGEPEREHRLAHLPILPGMLDIVRDPYADDGRPPLLELHRHLAFRGDGRLTDLSLTRLEHVALVPPCVDLRVSHLPQDLVLPVAERPGQVPVIHAGIPLPPQSLSQSPVHLDARQAHPLVIYPPGWAVIGRTPRGVRDLRQPAGLYPRIDKRVSVLSDHEIYAPLPEPRLHVETDGQVLLPFQGDTRHDRNLSSLPSPDLLCQLSNL